MKSMKYAAALTIVCIAGVVVMSGCDTASSVVPAVTTVAKGDVRLPAVISDNMVIQQGGKVTLWGWAAPRDAISIKGDWQKSPVIVTADESGKWAASIDAPKAGGPYTLTFKAANTITLKNIMCGEVWVCSGQSNMQFTIGKGQRWYTGDVDGEATAAAANYPNIRFFTVPPKYNDLPQDDCNSTWKVCDPESVKMFSAVGYYFGRKLHTTLGVPVGLICSAYGGTPAEAWTKRDAFAVDSELAGMLAAYDKDKAAFPQLRAQYDKEQAAWAADRASAAAAGREFTTPEPRKPSRVPNQNSPTVLWNAMVNPVLPFSMKGAIWYQGESNALKSRQYVTLFQTMISSWRKEWKQGDFPFYFVQIAPYKGLGPEIREAQRIVSQRVPNSGMVVTTDVGNCNDIHPRSKGPVGERLANWALAKTYGAKDVAFSSPMYRDMKLDGAKVRLSFDFADGGLLVKGEKLEGFTVAGADRKFLPADAVVEGQTVVVWSDSVQAPAAVRFGWGNCPTATLFNKAGLPASPFRTDEWPWETEAAN